MKVCRACGDTYRDHVDFCFNDGEILALADAEALVGAAPESELDAPLPRMVQGGQAVAGAQATVPLPNAAAPAAVPAANAPDDALHDQDRAREEGEGEFDDLRDAPDGQVDEEADPEVTAVTGIDDAAALEPTEVLDDREGGGYPEPDGGLDAPLPLGRASMVDTQPPFATDTVPPAPTADEPREPMRVAPLSEAETVPFVRPQRRAPAPADADDTPLSAPRVAARTGAPLHVPPPPKRRVGGAGDPPDRSNILWFGAILMGVAVAVPFLAGVAVIWFLVVGIGTGPGGGDVVIEPRQVGMVHDPPRDEPETPVMEITHEELRAYQEAEEAEADAIARSEVPDEVPEPAIADQVPVPAAPPGPAEVTIRFFLPAGATVHRNGAKVDLDDANAVVLPEGRYVFTIEAPGYCPDEVTWPDDARGDTLAPTLNAGCGEDIQAASITPVPAPRPQPKAVDVEFAVFGPEGRVLVDGKEVGRTSQTLPLHVVPGPHACVVHTAEWSHDWTCEIPSGGAWFRLYMTEGGPKADPIRKGGG